MKTFIRRFSILLMLLMCLSSGVRYFVKAEVLTDTNLNDVVAIDVDCSAVGMAMLELDSGRLIMQKNKDKRLPMASTTKIMTAITVIEHTKSLDKTVVIPDEAVGVEGSSIYLQRGEELSIRDLLYGLMLQSGNDCAVALAIITGGSVENFAEMMNTLAAQIGANNTHFVNPHGLHDDSHYTTAYDLALISAYAMKNPVFAEIVGTKVHKTTWKDHDYGRVIVNKNKIISIFEGGNGIKTGFTKKAGRCLVSSAQRDGKTVICVVLNCGPMFEECSRLMNLAFKSLVMSDIICTNVSICQVKVENGKEDFVDVGLESIVNYPLSEDEAKRLEFKFDLPEEVSAPVKKGERIGKINIYLDNRLLFSEDLFTINSVERKTFWDWLKGE
ncbi:MAG: D-alanyl-D-alanine carboxypeptidase [Clostridiales bacterium]|nr:D-alanyl-D-alanine carboxypeptidase [Clostridiales bacterium]